MDKEKFLKSGLLEQFVLGLTSPEENQLVEQYADAFPDIREEIESMHRALEDYAAQHAIPPPKKLRQQVFSEIDSLENENRPAKPRSQTSARSMFTTAGLLILALLSTWLYRQNHDAGQQIESLEASLIAAREDCEKARQEAAVKAAIYADIIKESTAPILLAGTEIAPDHFALAYWNPTEKKGWIDPTHLPELPADKQFQIWADIDGEMIPVGKIEPGERTIVQIKFLEKAESLNITQEPLGGSDHPNVDLLTVAGDV